MRSTNFFERVYEVVKQIPEGKVATYGQIAYALGSPRAARQVGFALHVNPEPFVIPCHRVVNRFGRLAPAFAFGGEDVQAGLLKNEGVEVDGNHVVDLSKYLYQGNFIVGE
ncbi:MAG: MGMT family protein [Clostridia bacterium]|nr:MGMT family protein [Clostridia bacterium]